MTVNLYTDTPRLTQWSHSQQNKTKSNFQFLLVPLALTAGSALREATVHRYRNLLSLYEHFSPQNRHKPVNFWSNR